jgi:hypothetical protein
VVWRHNNYEKVAVSQLTSRTGHVADLRAPH